MKTILISFLILVFFISSYSQNKIYVNQTATGANNGSSWIDAYTDLQDALPANEGDTIWVAQGTYYPDTLDGNTFASFTLSNNVHLLGGFNGTEPNANERNPLLYETILSGDLNMDDVDNDFTTNKDDNVMTVVNIGSSITNATEVDGFTIQNGYADGVSNNQEQKGAGIYSAGSPVIKHCIFNQNYAIGNGGAISQNFGSGELVLESCSFENNASRDGGGVSLWRADFEISNCHFQGNYTFDGTYQANGGGIRIASSSGTVQGCTFKENQAFDYGGGMLVWYPNATYNLEVEVINCVFENNLAGIQSGGLAFAAFGSSGTMLVDSCQFKENTATGGSGLAADLRGAYSNFTMTNTDFSENNTTQYYGIANITSYDGTIGSVTIDNCNFYNNNSIYSAGLEVGSGNSGDNYDFFISNCSFLNNHATTFGGALDIWGVEGATPTFEIENCLIEGNSAGEKAGGFWVDVVGDLQATMKNCKIIGNESPQGAAIDIFQYDLGTNVYPESAQLVFENCLVAENTSSDGIISIDSFPSVNFLNCTIAKNEGTGIINRELANVFLQNTILHNVGLMEIETQSTNSSVVSLGGNLLRDNSLGTDALFTDHGNSDPLFDGTGDLCNKYQLTEDSPAIGYGVPWTNQSSLDLCGNERDFGGQIDIGAIESSFPGTPVKDVIAENLKLSPNPATDFITIDLPKDFQGDFVANIFDTQGKLVSTQTMSHKENINIQILTSGVYSIKIVNDRKVYIGRFIKS